MANNNRNEINISLSGGRIISAKVAPNGTCNLVIETVSEGLKANIHSIFVLVEASKLSLDDVFMKYLPKTQNEKILKALITEAINKRVDDFYRPIVDPSYSENNKKIEFEFGAKPAIGYSQKWWENKAIGVNQVRKSRLGTKIEYGAFLGVLIKELIHNGWNVGDAWNSVCNDSKELGHYKNSLNSERTLEDSGLRKVWTWFDLGNVRKILAMDEDEGGFWFAGGSYNDISSDKPLSHLEFCKCVLGGNYDSVGWIVFEK